MDTITQPAPDCIRQAAKSVEATAEYVDQIRQIYFLLPSFMDEALDRAHGKLVDALEELQDILKDTP